MTMEGFDLTADRPERAPDLTGYKLGVRGPINCRAWRMDSERQHREAGKTACCAVANWLIEAPWAHPAWHSYWLVCMHLRPIAGVTTHCYLTGATHEMWLYALNPLESRREFDRTGKPPILNPKNFSAQFIAASDIEAANQIDAAAQAIVDGTLSPDTDFRHQWIARFGDNMLIRGIGDAKVHADDAAKGGAPDAAAASLPDRRRSDTSYLR